MKKSKWPILAVAAMVILLNGCVSTGISVGGIFIPTGEVGGGIEGPAPQEEAEEETEEQTEEETEEGPVEL